MAAPSTTIDWSEVWDNVVDIVTEPLEEVWGWVEKIIDVAEWVLEWTQILYPVDWYRWATAGDERMCPECGAMDGVQWEDGAAPVSPPLHVNCRCQVVYAWTEWRSRWVEDWRLSWSTKTEWDWKVTGWL